MQRRGACARWCVPTSACHQCGLHLWVWPSICGTGGGGGVVCLLYEMARRSFTREIRLFFVSCLQGPPVWLSMTVGANRRTSVSASRTRTAGIWLIIDGVCCSRSPPSPSSPPSPRLSLFEWFMAPLPHRLQSTPPQAAPQPGTAPLMGDLSRWPPLNPSARPTKGRQWSCSPKHDHYLNAPFCTILRPCPSACSSHVGQSDCSRGPNRGAPSAVHMLCTPGGSSHNCWSGGSRNSTTGPLPFPGSFHDTSLELDAAKGTAIRERKPFSTIKMVLQRSDGRVWPEGHEPPPGGAQSTREAGLLHRLH